MGGFDAPGLRDSAWPHSLAQRERAAFERPAGDTRMTTDRLALNEPLQHLPDSAMPTASQS